MLPGKNRHGRDTNERFQALLPRILLKLCSDTAARTHPVSCRSRGGQALLQPRDQSRERGELHVRSVVGRRERASGSAIPPASGTRPPGRRRGSPSTWTAPRGTVSSRYRRGELPSLVSARPRVLPLHCPAGRSTEVRFSTAHRCVCHSDNLYAR
jgi:hypothetical protein